MLLTIMQGVNIYVFYTSWNHAWCVVAPSYQWSALYRIFYHKAPSKKLFFCKVNIYLWYGILGSCESLMVIIYIVMLFQAVLCTTLLFNLSAKNIIICYGYCICWYHNILIELTFSPSSSMFIDFPIFSSSQLASTVHHNCIFYTRSVPMDSILLYIQYGSKGACV